MPLHGLEQLAIHQGAMFFGLIVLVAVAYVFINAVVKKDQ